MSKHILYDIACIMLATDMITGFLRVGDCRVILLLSIRRNRQ